jgi:hypothetical protein
VTSALHDSVNSSTCFIALSSLCCLLNCTLHTLYRGPCPVLSFDNRFRSYYSRLAIPRSLNTSAISLAITTLVTTPLRTPTARCLCPSHDSSGSDTQCTSSLRPMRIRSPGPKSKPTLSISYIRSTNRCATICATLDQVSATPKYWPTPTPLPGCPTLSAALISQTHQNGFVVVANICSYIRHATGKDERPQ